MMISIDEANARGDDGPEDVKAAGHPSYDDLLEENKYLRSEVSRFYEEVVIPPRSGHECYDDIDIQHSEHEYEYRTVCSEQKTSFRDLESNFKVLQADFNHLQAHSNEQAVESRRASRTIEELQYELNVANAELLQILPLRLKLTESNKKIENLRKDNVATGEDLSNLQHEKHILASRLDHSRTSLENMQNELKIGIVQSARLEEEIGGELKYLNQFCAIAADK